MNGDRRTLVLVISAFVVLAIPTAFEIFPGLDENPRPMRLLLFLLWMIAALLVGVTSTRFDERAAAFFGGEAALRRDERFLAGSKAIKLVLTNLPSQLEGYEFRLYLPADDDAGTLTATYGSHEPYTDVAAWYSDVGVTGRAYYLNEYQKATGREVYDETFGLTPAQQETQRQAGWKVVAAMPLRNFAKECVGVLTGATKTDNTFLVTIQGVDQHIELAIIISRLLIDVLREASD